MVVFPRQLAFYVVVIFVICLEHTGDAQTLFGQVGQSIEIPCYDSGERPVFSVAWRTPGETTSVKIYLNGELTDKHRADKYPLNTTTFQIRVLNIKPIDAGIFVCSSDNQVDFGMESFNRTLVVYSPPTATSTTIKLENTGEVNADTVHSVKCQAESIYPENSVTFTILSGNATVVHSADAVHDDDGSGTFTATLSHDVTFVSDYNTNKLKCQATYDGPGSNDAEAFSENLDVIVRYCDPLTIRTTNNGGPTRNAGTEVNIECTANCIPVRNIILYRTNIDNTDSNLKTVRGMTSLTHDYTLQKGDNGLHFYCDAEGSRTADEIFYDVQFNATAVTATANPNAYASLGEDITIECLTDEANPTAAVEWSLSNASPSNSEVSSGNCCNAKKRKSIIIVTNVERSDNGQEITCSVPNTPATATSILSVAFYPSDVAFSFTGRSTVTVGESITVKCVTESFHLSEDFTEMRWKIGNSHDDDSNGFEDDDSFTLSNGANGEHTATSTYTFETTSELNGKHVTCVPRWNNNPQESLKRSETITVNYPTTVSVTGCGSGSGSNNHVDEGANCQLTCGTTGGYPVQFTYIWEFERNFEDGFASLSYTDATFSISSLTHEHAGKYRCLATNAGGTARHTKTVNVRYAPIGVGIYNNTFTYHAAEAEDITLHLTVRSYPSPARFTWRRGTVNVNSNRTPLDNDQTRSSAEVQNIGLNDFTEYSVQVQSGDSSLARSFTVILEQQGKPGRPRGFEVMSTSYRQIIFSFLPGLNGGFPQTLTVHPNSENGDDTPAVSEVTHDPEFGVRINVNLTDLRPLTNYTYFVSADNSYEGDRTESDSYTVRTRDEVRFDTNSLKYRVNAENVHLSWGRPDGMYYTVIIRQCMEENIDCLDHIVTDVLEKNMNTVNGTLFSLFVYQDLDRIFSADFEEESGSGGSNGGPGGSGLGTTIGLVVGILVFLVVIGAVVTLIIMRRVKSKNGGDDPKLNFDDIENNTAAAQENPSVTYATVDKSNKTKKGKNEMPAAAQENPSVTYATVDKSNKTKKKKVPTATLR